MAAHLSTDTESELFSFLEIMIDFKLHAIRMYVHDVDGTGFIGGEKGEREHCCFVRLKVERDEPIQKLSDASAFLAATHILL